MKDIIIYYQISRKGNQNIIDGFSDINNINFNNFNCSVHQFKTDVKNILIRRGYKATFERLYKGGQIDGLRIRNQRLI